MQAAKMMLVLSVITLISGLALGGLYQATHELAENNVLRFKKIPAVVDIYRAAGIKVDGDARDKLEEELLAEKRYVDVGKKNKALMFVVKKDGELLGLALEGSGQGFGGKLGIMVGIDLEDEKLMGLGITTMSETPGIGTRVRESGFTGQFVGMPGNKVFKVKKDGGDIDGISGATISSRAVAEALRDVSTTFAEHKKALIHAARSPAPAKEKP